MESSLPLQYRSLSTLYDQPPGRYESKVNFSFLKYFRDRERSAVLQAAGLDTPETLQVLDVGAGSGFYSRYAKKCGHIVHSVDLFPGPLKGLKGIVDKTIQANVEHLNLGRTYDRIICSGVFEFVDRPEKTFARLTSHLEPDGKLVFLCPRKGLGGTYYKIEKRFQGLKPRLFRRSRLEALGRRHGLKLTAFGKPLPTNMVLAFEPTSAFAAESYFLDDDSSLSEVA